VFVPCAKTKPWENATKGIYKDYNKIRNEHPNLFLVTISEPLAIVPQTLWNNFPQYDNPGLFKDTVQRSGGLFTRDFKTNFGVDQQYKIPFDESAYNTCITILSSTIKSFIENNRHKDMISFVEDFHGTSTHSDMLTKAGFTGKRLTKREKPRGKPYDYIKKNI
jgi:predicted RNA-binding protein